MTRVLPLMVAGATEDRLQPAPVIAVLTMTIDGQHDPFTPPSRRRWPTTS